MTSPTQRWITALAIGAVVAGAALVAIRGTSLPTVSLGTGADSIPTLTFWVTVVLVSLAWAYVLSGLLHAHRLVRLAAPVLFGLGVYELLSIGLPVATW